MPVRVAGGLLFIAYAAFVSLGLPDALTGVAWPSMRDRFAIPQGYLGFILAGAGTGYFASGFFAGRLSQLLGLGGLLAVSCGLVSSAMFGFSGASQGWMLIGCALVWGLGSGAIDASLNGFAANHFPPRHMSWLHACYSLGAAIGPLIMTAAVVGLQSWRAGYAMVGAAMFSMMVTFFATKNRWVLSDASSSNDVKEADKNSATENGSMRLRDAVLTLRVWWHALVFLFYTGLEALVGQWSFTLLTESRGFAPTAAGIAVGSYFMAIALGRIFSGLIAERMGLSRLIRWSMGMVLLGTILFALPFHPVTACLSLLFLGLGLASIFPCLMSQTPQRLGKALAQHAIGFQVAFATLGAALVPATAGMLIIPLGIEIVSQISVIVSVLMIGAHAMALLSDRQSRTN